MPCLKKYLKKYTFYILFSFVSNNVKLAFIDSVKKEILPTAAYLHFSDIQYPASQIRYPVGRYRIRPDVRCSTINKMSVIFTLAISLFLILPASLRFFPLIHSLARLLLAEVKIVKIIL